MAQNEGPGTLDDGVFVLIFGNDYGQTEGFRPVGVNDTLVTFVSEEEIPEEQITASILAGQPMRPYSGISLGEIFDFYFNYRPLIRGPKKEDGEDGEPEQESLW